MSNIPEARQLLEDMALDLDRHHAEKLRAIIDTYLYRAPRVRRAPDKCKPITPEIRRKIWQLADTDLHISEIAHRLGVGPGRVSEVLNGKR